MSSGDISETASLLISVSRPVLQLAGLGIFIPARSADQSSLAQLRTDLLTGEIEIFQNGTDHHGPLGQKIWLKSFQISEERKSICDILTSLTILSPGGQGQPSIHWAATKLISNNVQPSPGVKERREISHCLEVGSRRGRREQSSLLH